MFFFKNIPPRCNYDGLDLKIILPLQKLSSLQPYFCNNCGRPDQMISANLNPFWVLCNQVPPLFPPLVDIAPYSSTYEFCLPFPNIHDSKQHSN